MARPVKTLQVSARVDERFNTEVETYADLAEFSVGELIRLALKEYMTKHPIIMTEVK